MSDEKKEFTKTPKQVDAIKVLCSIAIDILFFGGSRSGKTFIIIFAIFVRALLVKSRHLIVRYRFNHVKQSIWMDTIPKVISICFPELKGKIKENKSDWLLTLPNGSEIWIGGLDDKDRTEKILGKEYSTIFFNEISQISYDSILIAKTRLAEKNSLAKKCYYDMNPTSKKHWAYKLFLEHKNPEDDMPVDPKDYATLQMNPADNEINIDENYMRLLNSMPESKKKRFMAGVFSDDNQGEVFDTKWIKRVDVMPDDLERIVVAIDPAVTSNENSDETGIIVAGRRGKEGFVLKDKTGKYTPEKMAKIAIRLYHQYKCDRIISEVNNGGDFIETVLRHEDMNISHKAVRATRGKVVRAEPVAALYEQRRIYHVGYLSDLEDEMSDMKYNQKEMTYSPNRADSLVWAMHYLFNLCQGEPRIRTL